MDDLNKTKIGVIGTILVVVIGGTVIYLEPTTERDLCSLSGETDIWKETEIEDLYYCEPEDVYKWCTKLSLTQKSCYLYKETNLEQVREDLRKTIFPNLIESNNTISKGWGIFEFNNIMGREIPTSSLNRFFPHGEDMVRNCVWKIKEDICTNETFQEKSEREICEQRYDSLNSTYYDFCYTETTVIREWTEEICEPVFTGMDTIPVGMNTLKLECELELMFGDNSIDWVPEFEIYGNKFTRDEWAWWNMTYMYRYKINNKFTTTPYPISVNGTHGIGTYGIVWAMVGNDSYVYCQNSGCGSGLIAIANETHEKPWQSELTGQYNDLNLLWDENYMFVYHVNQTDFGQGGRNINAYGTPEETDALFGRGTELDSATTEGFTHDYGKSMDSQNNSYTLQMWIYPVSNGTDQQLFYWITSGDGYVQIIRKPDRTIRFYQEPDNVPPWDDQFSFFSDATTDNTWYFAYMTWNGTHTWAWLNGEPVGPPAFAIDKIYYGYNRCLGVGYDCQYNRYGQNGIIDEIRYSNVYRGEEYMLSQYYSGIGNLTSLGPEEQSEDDEYPTWRDMEKNTGDPTTYTYVQNYGFSVNFTDNVAMSMVLMEHNASGSLENMTCSNTGDIYFCNITSMGAGVMRYSFIGNDTSNNQNRTDYDTFTVNKGDPTTGMTLTGTSPISYGTASDFEGTETNEGDSDLSYKLYRNGTEVSNPDTTVLGSSTYNYTYSTDGGVNYTSGQEEDTLTVNSISLIIFQYGQVFFYNDTHITYNLSLIVVNNYTDTITNINVIPDSDFGDPYNIPTIESGDYNETFIGENMLVRGMADTDYIISKPIFSGNYTGDSNTLQLINPIDPPTALGTKGVVDSCTPPVSGDWSIICSDNCTIKDDDVVIVGNIYIDDTNGTFTVSNSTLTYSDIHVKRCRIVYHPITKIVQTG